MLSNLVESGQVLARSSPATLTILLLLKTAEANLLPTAD